MTATSMPHGMAMAMVATVSRNVYAVPAASASRCCHTTDQSRIMPSPPSGTTQMRNAAVEPVHAARDGEQQHEIQQHREGEHLDRLEALAGHRLGLAHELTDGNHRCDSGVLDRQR